MASKMGGQRFTTGVMGAPGQMMERLGAQRPQRPAKKGHMLTKALGPNMPPALAEAMANRPKQQPHGGGKPGGARPGPQTHMIESLGGGFSDFRAKRRK